MAGRPRSRAKARAKASGTLAVQPSAAAFKRLEQAGIECGVDPLAMEQLVVRLQGRPPSAEGLLGVLIGAIGIDTNFRCGSNPEVSDGHENVCFRGLSGSRFRAAGGLFFASI